MIMESSNSRHRRGIGFVTPNACTECRKKRTKCDGQTPCGRCKTLDGVSCVYELPPRQSKDEMRKEILQLRSRQRQLEEILASIVPQDVSDGLISHLQIRDGGTLEGMRSLGNLSSTYASASGNVTTYSQPGHFQAISHALGPAQNAGSMSTTALSYDPFANTFPGLSRGISRDQKQRGEAAGLSTDKLLQDNRQLDTMDWSSIPTESTHSSHPAVGIWQERSASATFDGTIQSSRSRGQDVIFGDGTGPEMSWEHKSPKYTRESWTTVTADKKIVEHFLALYFCWDYPTFASLSKKHFMEDFRLGIPRYCSPLLVNALLALGCRFSDQPIARADPNNDTTTGDHFFAEAVKLFGSEGNHRVLTTIQALGIMSLREASCGRVNESIYLSGQSIRLAIEMGLHLDAEDDQGISDDLQDESSDLDGTVRQATFWGAFALDEMWSLCTGTLPHFSKSCSLPMKPAIVQPVEAAEWIPYTDDGGPIEQNCVQPSNIRSVYKTFCELSEIVHLTLYTFYTPGSSFTSKALLEVYSQYIHWYGTIPDALRLGQNFTPAVLFSHLYYHFAVFLLFRPFIEFDIIGSDFTPRDICDQASHAISAIIKSYSDLYTLRRTPSFLPYFVLSSAMYQLAEVRNDLCNASSKGLLARNMADLKNLSDNHGFAARALDAVRFLGYKWKISSIFGEKHDESDAHNRLEESLISMNQLVPVVGEIAVMQGRETQDSTAGSVLIKRRVLVAVNTELENNGFRRLGGPQQV